MKNQSPILSFIFFISLVACVSCSKEKKSNGIESTKSLDTTINNSKILGNTDSTTSKSVQIENIANGEIIEDENDCIGTRDCSVDELITKVKNRHNKSGNRWDVGWTGGSQFDSYIDNGKWLFDVIVMGEMNKTKGSFYIIVSTDCDCNITLIEKRSK